jgi:hypothetical protein
MTRWLYVPLAVLHGSLVLRVMGDLLMDAGVRRWGGMLNALALLGYVAAMVFAARRARLKGPAAQVQLQRNCEQPKEQTSAP